MHVSNKHYNLIHNYKWKGAYLSTNIKYLTIRINDQYSRRVVLDSYDMKIINDYSRQHIIGLFFRKEGECINY